MNLGKVYKKIFEGRKKDYFELLKEAPQMGTGTSGGFKVGSGAPAQDREPIDIEYYSDQLNKLMDTIRDFHQDIGTEIEMKGDETGNYEYETMEKQLSRYIQGAEKQLDSLQKYLERQKGKGL